MTASESTSSSPRRRVPKGAAAGSAAASPPPPAASAAPAQAFADTSAIQQQMVDAWTQAWRVLMPGATQGVVRQNAAAQAQSGSAQSLQSSPFSPLFGQTPPDWAAWWQGLTAMLPGAPFASPLLSLFPQAAPVSSSTSAAAAGAPSSASSLPSPFAAFAAFGNVPNPAAGIAPERLTQLQTDYSREALALLQQAANAAPALPELKDRRFSADAWKATPACAFMAAWYLLNARYLHELASAVEGDPKTRERIRFAVEQWTAAASPSNFLAFNPDVQRTLLETHGESLRQGLTNLLGDMQRGKISQTDESCFVVGRNLAVTEGTVVFENDLIQLIQYRPRTEKVYARPLLIVPPCINKFYILDLQPDNSLVQYALDNGQQVFLVSWRNVDASLAHKTWDDYISEGVLAAIDVTRRISASEQINTLGFCVGGTMLATALAVANARGERLAASMTLLTALLDFSETGILDVFVDEAHVQMREQTIGGKDGAKPGLMRGLEFANTFSFLRPNDLVWNYVVDNYLKGRTPAPFDLLYWNSDSTNLPGPMHAWYLRNTYLENRLREPGALSVCGEKVDLSSIDVPAFIYGSREDHIVPWRSAYASAPLLGGPQKFVLGASGHIAGVVNPPAKKKRSYWSLDADASSAALGARLPQQADEWFARATETPGSWWPVWIDWLSQYGGDQVAARAQPGSKAFPAIEPAPGRYVQQRD